LVRPQLILLLVGPVNGPTIEVEATNRTPRIDTWFNAEEM
jgi:hypothetical protein